MAVKFKRNVGRVMQKMERRITTRLKQIGRLMHDYFGQVLVGQRSGRIYFEPKINKEHQSSSKEEYPAFMTGDLLRSMEWRTGKGDFGPILNIGSDLHYALELETRDSNYGGRPFLSRAMAENLDDIKELLRKPYA